MDTHTHTHSLTHARTLSHTHSLSRTLSLTHSLSHFVLSLSFDRCSRRVVLTARLLLGWYGVRLQNEVLRKETEMFDGYLQRNLPDDGTSAAAATCISLCFVVWKVQPHGVAVVCPVCKQCHLGVLNC